MNRTVLRWVCLLWRRQLTLEGIGVLRVCEEMKWREIWGDGEEMGCGVWALEGMAEEESWRGGRRRWVLWLHRPFLSVSKDCEKEKSEGL